MNALGHRQVDEPGERAVAGEDTAAPPRTSAKYLAERSIQRLQVLLLADSLAVRRVAQDRPWCTVGRAEFTHVEPMELQQMPNTGSTGVGVGVLDRVAPHIGAEDRGWQRLANVLPGLVADFGPEPNVKIGPTLEAKPPSRQS